MKSKILKYSVLLILLGISAGGIYYLKLPNRHKAIVKTRLLHSLGLVDNTWNFKATDSTISLITPTLVIDNIYKSMEGPKAMTPFQIDATKSDLIWLASFKTAAVSTNEVDRLSDDYVCHTNIDFYENEHYSKWQLENRIGKQYPRLATLSNGIESYYFPDGFGFPVFTNENLFLITQSLNHNIKSESFSIKHKVTLGFKPNSPIMKPVMERTAFVMLPYDENHPFNAPHESDANMCIPVDTKNHSYVDDEGHRMSGHWVIFPGEATYSSDVTKQLLLTDSTTVHFMVAHLHPFAESLSLVDKTIDSTLFTSKAENYTDKIGLTKVSSYSSKLGMMLYPNHQYELVLKTNNTSNVDQDMMASIFMFLYDKEMSEKLKNSNLE